MWWLQGSDSLQPSAALVGAELAVKGSGIKGEQIISMSQMYQKQKEKLSDSFIIT